MPLVQIESSRLINTDQISQIVIPKSEDFITIYLAGHTSKVDVYKNTSGWKRLAAIVPEINALKG